MPYDAMHADSIAALVPILRRLAVVHPTMAKFGAVSNRNRGIGKTGVPEGIEGMQGTAKVWHDVSGVANRRSVDRVVAQAEFIRAVRQVQERAS